MKKITHIFRLLFLVFIITSCSQDFLDKKPLDKFSDADVWNDPALIETFVNDMYYNFGNPFDIDMIACYVDESHFTPDWGVRNFNNSLLTPDEIPGWQTSWFGDNTIGKRWQPLYKSIRAANIFFSKIGDIEADDQDLIDRLTGEAHFARAYFYHNLVALYGGVPLIIEPYGLDDEFTVPRSSYADCIDFIVSELDKAANLLPESHSSANEGRATEGAALALKARVLLYAASDLHNNNSLFSGFSNPELLGYTSGDATARWTAAKNAAKAVIDMGIYSLHGPEPANAEEATQNYVEYFTSMGSSEDIFLKHYLTKGYSYEGWSNSMPGLFCGPNGYHNWGNNCPIGALVDDYEMADGTKFDWNNPAHKADPYGIFGGQRRDPRFYANVLFDGAKWRARPTDVANIDPVGIIQTGKWQLSADENDVRHGLDTRSGPIEDWNGSYTGYYSRKGIDPTIDAQFEFQNVPFRWIRLAEVYLNYAEACLELGEEGEARKYINMIRKRAGMPETNESGAALKARYRNERRIELCYEEHRFYDVRRWVIANEVYVDANGIEVIYPWDGGKTDEQPTYAPKFFENRAWDNKAYFFPIYRNEMNRNDQLVQNPGY